VFAKEMLEIFRDRRTLIVSIFVPILMLPVTMAIFVYFVGSRLPEYHYAIQGGTEAEGVLIARLLADERNVVFVSVAPVDPQQALRRGDLEVIIAVEAPLAQTNGRGAQVVVRHSAEQMSQQAATLVAARLETYSQQSADRWLVEHGLEPTQIRPWQITLENVSPDRNPSVASIFFPLIVLIWITVGAMYPAADVTAGEKDRRTIGDLLLTPATRWEITLGKFLAVFVMSLFTLFVATVSTLVGVEIGHVSALRLDAAGATPVTLLLILPTALLTAAIVTALEMIACVFAKSFKESQTYLTPIFMAVLIPGGLLAVAPDLAHKEWLYWVPFMNNTLLIRELLLNVVSPLHIASTLLTSLVGSLALLAVITLLFNREDVLFRI
jgi:sodium transport system permease protein